MTKQHPRIQAVGSAFLGEPSEPLENRVNEKVRHGLSSEQGTRLESAINGRICVFPEREGLYRVRSLGDDNGVASEYTVDMMYSDAKTCTCSDFMYRLEPHTGQMCKHLWRTTILINIGVLPAVSRNPYDWLLDELARDVQLLKAMESGHEGEYDELPSTRMDALKSEVERTHRIVIQYPRICILRAEGLAEL